MTTPQIQPRPGRHRREGTERYDVVIPLYSCRFDRSAGEVTVPFASEETACKVAAQIRDGVTVRAVTS